MSRNSRSIASIFVENSGSFSKLKLIGLDQRFLKVSVENGNLIYRSNGHIWQYGRLKLTFPDWLLLGKATIIETPVSDKQFRLDFSINHRLWGECYWYHGVFQYCE